MLDLRKPAGYFFLLLGLLLLATGLLAPGFSAPLLEGNLNLGMGGFMMAFGGVFLWLAKRA
jgi:hypothetical protein